MVGHVAFSPAVPADHAKGWYTLGPVSVEPDVQRQGIGEALIRTGLRSLQALNATGCIVLGDTNYYSRFGFLKAPDLSPAADYAEHFMVLSLTGQTPACRFGFHTAFEPEG
jgi:putative acetyltransferase